MTLVKTKRRVSVHQRKVEGNHHRKSQKYTKTYWPYLPIIAILGGSAAVSQFFISSPLISSFNPEYGGSEAGLSSNMLLLLSYAVLIVLVVWFSIRHVKRIKKLILASEHVLAKHYVLDVAIALMIGGIIIVVH